MQAKLNDARLIAIDQTVDTAERRIAAPLIRQTEARMVREVKHLHAELQDVAFTNAEVFQDCWC